MKIVMFGCGNMGRALLEEWRHVSGSKFSIVDPNVSETLDGVTFNTSSEAFAGEVFDVVIVAIKPQMIETLAPMISRHVGPQTMILSIAAGFSTERLAKLLNSPSVVRMMPNMPAAIAEGMGGLYATDAVTSDQRRFAETLARQNGDMIWVDTEDQIDRFTAVAGSGPGYIFELLNQYAKAAEALGFDEEQARTLAIKTIAGTALMAASSEKSFEDLRKAVTSPQGTTEAGLNKFMADETLSKLLKSTFDAAYNRAIELR